MLADRTGGSDRPGSAGYFMLPEGTTEGLLAEWHSNRLKSFIKAAAGLLADNAGASETLAVFLCGSFSGGEGSVFEHGGKIVFLSDIDIVIIVRSLEVHDRLLADRERLGEQCERLAEEAEFLGRVEVGVMIPESLGGLGKTPGVFGMIDHSRVILGDSGITRQIPPFSPQEIGGEEGVTLLENRIIPHLGLIPAGRGMDFQDGARFLYQISRSYTDIVTASLCSRGLYAGGYAKRLEVLEESREDPVISWITGGEEMIAKAAEWTRFKLNPDPYGYDLGADSIEKLWSESARDLIRVWRRCEALLHGYGPGASEPPGTAELAKSKRRRENGIDNIRRWRKFARQPGSPSLPLLMSRRLRDVFSMGPLDVIRMEGVILLEKILSDGKQAEVAGRPARFPYGRGRAPECAAYLHSHWKRAVFGREG